MTSRDAHTHREGVLSALPDDALHVEARGLLLGRPRAIVVGPIDASGGFVFAPEHGIAVGFGDPATELAEELRDVADQHGMVQVPLELHLPVAASEHWLALAETRLLCEHRIQTLGAEPLDAAKALSSHVRYECEVLESRRDHRLETLPRALRGEFASMDPWPVVMASLAGESIACIASAFVETESFFDVSIDTVPDFRRAGFGASCAAALIQHEAALGKRPVWMVRANNRASLALSAKLGFVDVGRVVGLELSD